MYRPILISLLILTATGCSTNPTDPYQSLNRKLFSVNEAVDRVALRPVSQEYSNVTPDLVKRSVHNFFLNLIEPLTIINQLLQGELKLGAQDTTRWIVNTTIGLGGLADVARKVGLERHSEDFGQTLGRWGISSGPYLVIPFYGPTTLRDGFGDILGGYLYPPNYLKSNGARNAYYAARVIDTRASLLGIDQLITGDEYLFLRDAYLQNREFQVHGKVEDNDPFLDEDF